MAAKVLESKANNIVADRPLYDEDEGVPSTIISKELITQDPAGTSSSSCMMASQLSSDVDHWLRGYTAHGVQNSNRPHARLQNQVNNEVDNWARGYGIGTESTGVQNSRVGTQQSAMVAGPPLAGSGFWYVLAMALPLFSVNLQRQNWRCSPSTILNTAELLCGHLAVLSQRLRTSLRRLARDRMTQDLFAMVMDIVVVVYAVGFLIISTYQATLAG